MSASAYTCVCKRSFTAQNYFSHHQRSCSQTKKRLSSAIASFKEFIGRRKKARTSNDEPVPVGVAGSPNVLSHSPVDHLASGEAAILSQDNEVTPAPLPDTSLASVGGIAISDYDGGQTDGAEDMSLALRRTRRQNRQLPKRFRDVLPQPPPTVPEEIRDLPPDSAGRVVTSDERSALPVRTVFRTLPNIFGLVRQYFSSELPSHDPEEYVTLADLSFIPGSHQSNEEPHAPVASSSDSQYHPYPNRSSFELGDWYWNQGVQKSQGDYMKLMDILGGSTFNAAEVSSAHWKKINSQLGVNEYDEGDGQEWEDEDAGWKRTPVSIEVPFSRSTESPGPRLYEGADLYHRSIVAVLREKLANVRDDKLFHYEPYELHWTPPHLDAQVTIYGDMYTSPAFHELHRELQESPGEPGCDLPRVVAGLMFWSDATQLTSFGTAKLWPTYMYFGNESKYRRCKPSCNLSNHIAYFETVRLPTVFLPDT
jgi:hypothetical protein